MSKAADAADVAWYYHRQQIHLHITERRAVTMGDFGPFARAFDSDGLNVPGYLELLWCKESGTKLVVQRIQTALTQPDANKSVINLFQEPSWRPHLVGVIAALCSDAEDPYIELIWHAIDHSSWVTPQLVVAAQLKDPKFSSNAKNRIDRRCPVTLDATRLGCSPGAIPVVREFKSARVLHCLLHACTGITSLSQWAIDLLRTPEVQAIVVDDRDNSPSIMDEWRKNVRKIFQDLGLQFPC